MKHFGLSSIPLLCLLACAPAFAQADKYFSPTDFSAETNVNAANLPAQISRQYGYPQVGGHTGFLDILIGGKKSEGQKTKDQLSAIYQLGGMAGAITDQGKTNEIATVRPAVPHDCGHSSRSWAQAYLYAIQHTGGAPAAFGSDFNGFAGEPAPRFGDEACDGDKQAPQSAGVGYPFTV